jgi:hypothetical protein
MSGSVSLRYHRKSENISGQRLERYISWTVGDRPECMRISGTLHQKTDGWLPNVDSTFGLTQRPKPFPVCFFNGMTRNRAIDQKCQWTPNIKNDRWRLNGLCWTNYRILFHMQSGHPLKNDIHLLERNKVGFTKRLPGVSRCVIFGKLENLHVPIFELRRLHVIINLEELFTLAGCCNNTIGHSLKLIKPHANVNGRLFFLVVRIVDIWNIL